MLKEMKNAAFKMGCKRSNFHNPVKSSAEFWGVQSDYQALRAGDDSNSRFAARSATSVVLDSGPLSSFRDSEVCHAATTPATTLLQRPLQRCYNAHYSPLQRCSARYNIVAPATTCPLQRCYNARYKPPPCRPLQRCYNARYNVVAPRYNVVTMSLKTPLHACRYAV